jgi:hypothetical protein
MHLIWRALSCVCRNMMNKKVPGKDARDTHQTRTTGLLQKCRLQAPNLAHKCKTSHRHSTISPVRHKGNELLLDIIQEARWASMVGLGTIANLRICWVLKSNTPPVNRVGANLKIVRSTDKRDTSLKWVLERRFYFFSNDLEMYHTSTIILPPIFQRVFHHSHHVFP